MDYIEDASLSFEKTFAVEDPSGIFDSGTTYITGFFNDETTNYPIDLMVKYTEEEEVRTADNKYKITAKVEAYDKIANTFKVIINVENNLVEPVDTIKGKLVGVAVICKNTYIIAAEKTFSLEDGQTYTITTGEETPETIETTEGTIANISFINDGGAARIVVNPSIENCETYSFTIDGLWTQSSGIIEELDDECKLYETYTTTWDYALDVKDLTYRLPNENGSIDVVTVADGEEGETNYSSEKIIQVKYENSSGYLTTEVIGYFMDSLLPYLIVEPTQKSTTRYEYTGTTAEIQGKINDETISITLTGSTEEATYKFNARSSTITVTVVDEDNEIAANVYCKYVPYEKLPDVLPTSSFEGTQFHNYIEYSGKYRPTAELSVDNKGNLLFTTDNSTVERNRVLHIDEDVTQGYLTLSSGAVATTWLPELKLELISAKNKKTITFNPNPEGAKPSKTNTIQIHQDYCKTIIVNGKKYAVDDDNTIVLGSTTWTEEKSALLDTAVQKIKFNGEDKVGPEVVIDQKESVVEGSDWIVVDAEEVDNTTTYNVSHATINYRQPTISTPLIFNESNKTKTFNTIITEHIKNGHIEQGAAYEIDLTDIFNKISALEARIASLEAGE